MLRDISEESRGLMLDIVLPRVRVSRNLLFERAEQNELEHSEHAVSRTFKS